MLFNIISYKTCQGDLDALRRRRREKHLDNSLEYTHYMIITESVHMKNNFKLYVMIVSDNVTKWQARYQRCGHRRKLRKIQL
jgi:metal-responsive CopG/Arc/MetJ family transcriptional regulator